MKILFYIHAISGGGAERVLVTVANHLAAEGKEIVLATDTSYPCAYSLSEDIKLVNMYEGATMGSKSGSIQLRKNIRKIAKSENPDIIVGFLSALGCMVTFSTLGLGIPVIVCEHTNVSRFLGHALNIKRKLLYPLANCVTVLTRYDYALWRKKVSNVVYLPNPVPLVKENLSQNRRKVVFAAGRVNQWEIKGFDNLIKCWSVLCHEFPDWTLQIAGDGDEKSLSYLNGLIEDTGATNVEFLGFRKDVKDLMQTSEIFCLSSRVEGLPMALIEAMNAGCCCVSFDVKTGPREIIVNGKSGLIAEDQNNADLTDKLRMVMKDDVLRRTYASNAPSSVEKYSTERVLQRWNILFNKILHKK